MARLIYDTSTILDAAARLAASGNVGDITMAGVIRESGIPSGSVYHRFPDRMSLLGALWNRTVERYHSSAYPLFNDDEPVAAAVGLARYTVDWSRRNPVDAQVLHFGPTPFEPDTWPEPARLDRKAEQDRWDQATRQLIRGLRSTTRMSTAELLLLVVDVPYAAVARYLRSRHPMPANLGDLVAALLTRELSL